MMKLPMAALGPSQPPAILLKALDHVANFHPSGIVIETKSASVYGRQPGAVDALLPHILIDDESESVGIAEDREPPAPVIAAEAWLVEA
jgi:hypothetical protein